MGQTVLSLHYSDSESDVLALAFSTTVDIPIRDPFSGQDTPEQLLSTAELHMGRTQ